eukprot:jgi/Botrbrau1/22537/Bobra.114_2s0061.1
MYPYRTPKNCMLGFDMLIRLFFFGRLSLHLGRGACFVWPSMLALWATFTKQLVQLCYAMLSRLEIWPSDWHVFSMRRHTAFCRQNAAGAVPGVGSGAMLALPEDLLIKILDTLDKPALGTARLVCRNFRAASIQCMLGRLRGSDEEGDSRRQTALQNRLHFLTSVAALHMSNLLPGGASQPRLHPVISTLGNGFWM